jgi:ribonucleotide monophosphatase NagD (HAD superfamily)
MVEVEETFATFDEIVEKYDYFLFDCDGVLWQGSSEIENALKALSHLMSLKKEVYLITNNSSRLRQSVIDDKLVKIGGPQFTDFPLSHIYTSAYVTG